MTQIKRKDIKNDKLNFLIGLEEEFTISGTLNTFEDNNSENILNVSPSNTIILTGNTDSRLSEITNSFVGETKINQSVRLPNNLYGKINTINDSRNVSNFTGYTIGDINYVDYENNTTFSVVIENVENGNQPTTFIENKGYIEAPDIDNNIFINRGVNSIFESMQKLKITKSVNEVEKVGFGFFNIQKEG